MAGLASVLVLALGVAPPGAAAASKSRAAPAVDARAWLLVDADTGKRLAAHDQNRPRAIASTTKLMTAYLALERLPLRRRLTAADYRPTTGESLLGLKPGERDTVRDLLYGLLLPSGNDAAVTLAVGVAGSVPAFVRMMNRAARRLGLRNTHYATPVGLDSPGNYSTARDLVRLATILLRDRRFAHIVNTPAATLRDGRRVRHVENTNDLLESVPWVDGVKTGYTADAGYVLVSAARRHGVRLISAVLGAPTMADRDADGLELLRYGFSLYHAKTVLARGEPAAHVRAAYSPTPLPLEPVRDVRVWTRRGQGSGLRIRAPGEVEGPLARGRRLGVAVVRRSGRPAARVPLVTGRSLPSPPAATAIEAALPWSPNRGAIALLGVAAVVAGVLIGALVALRPGR
jgi:D-alanyl-D-alanine carboxypeptidase (penicillin-binding protein 5/6)